MKETQQYIKKILALLICAAIFMFALQYLAWYLALAPSLLAFSLVMIRITGELPKELFDYTKAEQYYNKGGLRELFRLLVMLVGFIYDLAVYTIWGVIDVFLVFTDIILLIKNIIFWIIYAILWFLKLYAPFWRLLYYNFVHYLLKWPWWIYQNSFKNIKYTYHKNSYRIAIIGSAIALFIFQVFYFLEISLDIPLLRYVGVILALLPVAWVFGIISSLRAENKLNESWTRVQFYFDNGLESVRSLLFFIGIFVSLLTLQIGLNLLGWVPIAGITISSFTININTLISAAMIAVALLIFFAVLILPTYRLFTPFNESSINHSWIFLKKSLFNILHYISFFIPASFFGVIASIVPIVIVSLSLWLAVSIKGNIAQVRLNELSEKITNSTDVLERYKLEKDKKDMVYIKTIPGGIEQDMRHRDNILAEIEYTQQQIEDYTNGYNLKIEKEEEDIIALSTQLNDLKQKQYIDQKKLEELKNNVNKKQSSINSLKTTQKNAIDKLTIDLSYLAKHKKQLPLIFYFINLLLIVLGTFVLAAFLGYMAHVLYDVYTFRNNRKITYFSHSIRNEQNADYKQPLLSTTLNIITLTLIVAVLFSKGIIQFLLSW